MKLTEHQINVLLPFFLDGKYAGSENIGRKLLETGVCIVAGEECIWKGGIGNFIKTKKAENLVGCLEYTFDVEYFLTSEWCKEYLKDYTSDILKRIDELTLKINNVKQESLDVIKLLNK